jgi:hypothetical protein
MGNLFSGNMFSFHFRKTSAWDYQRRLLRPWPTSPLRSMWAAITVLLGRDYAMWATITVKHKMRPTSERNPGPHHTGICGPHPMESPAHIDRNTHRDTQTVTLHMISIDKKNPKCKDLMGDETTIDAHLIDLRNLEMQRTEELEKKREALFLYSDSAKNILEPAK